MDRKNQLRFNMKLQEIRRQKELALEAEEHEEEMIKQKEDKNHALFLEQERRQDEYEAMLLHQNRLDELQFERLQRRLQNLHYDDGF